MTTTLDAEPGSFVARLPAAWRPYARLSRADRPVGFWLLALPCFMGQALGRVGEGVGLLDLQLALAWIIGAIAMRGAGCSFNDLVDRDIDAQVARTALRPIPAGEVSPKAALVWTIAQCLVGLVVLLTLPPPAQIVALLAIPMVAAYPFMKRITWWPQVWLGLTFNWGVLVGYAAVEGTVNLAALALFAACALWTVGYDTIYALQDVEDDALVGVKSTARLFGAAVRRQVTRFYGACLALVVVAMLLVSREALLAVPAGLIALVPFALHLRRQAAATRPDLPPGEALALFKSNRGAGLWLIAALAVLVAAKWLLELPGGAPQAIVPPA